MSMPVSYTKYLLFISFILFSSSIFANANKPDSLKQVDSLKKELQLTVSDSLKGPLYTQIASEYLKFDTISNKKERLVYQEEVLKNTLLALRNYSRYGDTTGLRISFNNLAYVYHAQKKYSQAKWFILQSNTLSRMKNDSVNIIASLIELASIKKDIKDFKLALRDLKEAQQISAKNHYARQQSEVQLGYALLYTSMKNPAKAAIALKRHRAIDDSIKKAEEIALVAKEHSLDSVQLVKKKVYMISNKRISRLSSSRRLVSL